MRSDSALFSSLSLAPFFTPIMEIQRLVPLILVFVNLGLGGLSLLFAIIYGDFTGGPLDWISVVTSQRNFQSAVLFLTAAILIYAFLFDLQFPLALPDIHVIYS
jgi:hypothetical protein